MPEDTSRSIALSGRIGPPAQPEKPSRRVFGFDPALDVLDGPWWKTPMLLPGDAVVNNTDGRLSGGTVGFSGMPWMPPPTAVCECGHLGSDHRNYWSTSLQRSVWACTVCDANAKCACHDFSALPAVDPDAPDYLQPPAALATLGVKLSASMASLGAAAAASAVQFTAAMQQVEATMAAIDQQAFVDGKPGNADKHARIKDLIRLARDISSTSGQSFTEVIAGMRAMGAFD